MKPEMKRRRLQKIVDDSEGAEQQLRELNLRRAGKQEQWATATANAASLQQLAQQATERSAAAELVRLAEQEVRRIKDLCTEVGATEARVAELTSQGDRSQRSGGHSTRSAKGVGCRARIRGRSCPRRRSGSQRKANEAPASPELRPSRRQAKHNNGSIASAGVKKLADAAHAAELAQQDQQAHADKARKTASEAEKGEKKANEELDRCSLLERALEVQAAEKQLRAAQAAVDHQAALTARVEEISRERASLVVQRAAITVPSPGALAPMRKLATELATARGALDVGFVAIVTPHRPLDLTVQRDGAGGRFNIDCAGTGNRGECGAGDWHRGRRDVPRAWRPAGSAGPLRRFGESLGSGSRAAPACGVASPTWTA